MSGELPGMPFEAGSPMDGHRVVHEDDLRAFAAAAWSEGHKAGRDYQGDGWNSDAHDPERDNPYRVEETP